VGAGADGEESDLVEGYGRGEVRAGLRVGSGAQSVVEETRGRDYPVDNTCPGRRAGIHRQQCRPANRGCLRPANWRAGHRVASADRGGQGAPGGWSGQERAQDPGSVATIAGRAGRLCLWRHLHGHSFAGECGASGGGVSGSQVGGNS